MTDQGIAVDQKYLDGVLDAYDLDQSGEIELGVLPYVATTHSPGLRALPLSRLRDATSPLTSAAGGCTQRNSRRFTLCCAERQLIRRQLQRPCHRQQRSQRRFSQAMRCRAGLRRQPGVLDRRRLPVAESSRRRWRCLARQEG